VERSRAAQDRAQAALAKAGVGSEEWQRDNLALARALIRMQAAARTGATTGGTRH
jgi:hypothetical protein